MTAQRLLVERGKTDVVPMLQKLVADTRLDAIGNACIRLPEDQGIVFPGGYYLQTGDFKVFEGIGEGLQFKRAIRSPNGEDVMYVFYEHEGGRSALFVYNLIQRKLQSPLFGHGHAVLRDGRMVLFNAEGDAPTRVHPMQIWVTPFVSDEFAASRPPGMASLAPARQSVFPSALRIWFSRPSFDQSRYAAASRFGSHTAVT